MARDDSARCSIRKNNQKTPNSGTPAPSESLSTGGPFFPNKHKFHPSKSENLSKIAKIKSENLSIFG